MEILVSSQNEFIVFNIEPLL